MSIRSAVDQRAGAGRTTGEAVLGSEDPGARDGNRQPDDGGGHEHPASQEPVTQESHGHRRTRAPRGTAFKVGLTVAVLAALAIVGGTVGLAFTSRPASHRAAGHASGRRRRPEAPIRVVSVTPASGSSKLSGALSVQVNLNVPVAADTATPQLSPHVAGQWQATGSTLTFTPNVPLPPSTTFTLRIPAGNAGIRSAAGHVLARPLTTHFKTAAYTQLRLAQLLSTLGYLPVSWQPGAGDRMTSDPVGGEVASQQEMAYSPPSGSFTWNHGYPAELRSQWRANRQNSLVLGAVMAFRAQHHMAMTATTGLQFWHKLFAAAQAGRRNAVGYTYALASKASPETLTIWHNGHVVLRSLANTGIPVAPTADGTFPVYLRYRFQIMRGTNPDGSHYADPVSFVAYFDGGDAVHYFPRGAYGFEQSLGCVELPYDAAEHAWPFLTYGSLVTVAG
jgi:Bacterial Ig-like domain/L,D-transpeptidase catalytic domain